MQILTNNNDTQQLHFGNQSPHLIIHSVQKVMRKSIYFYNTYSRAFKDFFSALDTLSNVTLTCQIINPLILERYVKQKHMSYKNNASNY